MRYGPSLDVVHDYETFLLERDRAASRRRSRRRRRRARRCASARSSSAIATALPRDRFARGEDVHVRMRIEADDRRAAGARDRRRPSRRGRPAVLRRRHARGRHARRSPDAPSTRSPCACWTCRCCAATTRSSPSSATRTRMTVFDRRDVRPGVLDDRRALRDRPDRRRSPLGARRRASTSASRAALEPR